MEKLDNEEYSPNKDGGTSTQNQVHVEFLYPDFEILIHSNYTINLDNKFLIKHKNSIHILAEEGDNIWGENVREELNEFKNYVEYIILPSKDQGQQIEQGAHLTSQCTCSGLNEYFTSAFVVVKPFDQKNLTMQHNFF